MFKAMFASTASAVVLLTAVTTSQAAPRNDAAETSAVLMAMNDQSSNTSRLQSRSDDGSSDADESGVLFVETFSKTAACVKGSTKTIKKVCNHTLAAPEGMMVVPGSIKVEGSGYAPAYTQASGNEVDFTIDARTMGKKSVTISADFEYAPGTLSQSVLAELQERKRQNAR